MSRFVHSGAFVLVCLSTDALSSMIRWSNLHAWVAPCILKIICFWIFSERCNDTYGGVRGTGSVWLEEPCMAHPRNLCPERWRSLWGLGLASEYLEGATSFRAVHLSWYIVILIAEGLPTQLHNALGFLSYSFSSHAYRMFVSIRDPGSGLKSPDKKLKVDQPLMLWFMVVVILLRHHFGITEIWLLPLVNSSPCPMGSYCKYTDCHEI